MPGGTIEVGAGASPVGDPRTEMRRQSTAIATAWRTSALSNGGLLVSKP